MRKQLSIAVALLAAAGCARFSTTQTDVSYEHPSNTTLSPLATVSAKPTRKITTRVSTWTFFDGNNALTKFRANQTEKSQSATVGTLSNETSGTNTVALLNALTGLVGALPK